MFPIFGTMYFGRIKCIINKFLQFKKKFSKVLEIGGGFGLFSANFKLNFLESEIFLLDIYPIQIMNLVKYIMTKKLEIHLNYNYECDIQNKTLYKDNSFDLIFALDILEHIDDVDLAFNELIRILNNKGLLFISVPIEGKIIKYFRYIFNKIKPINTNPHWNGKIKSEDEFFNYLKQKEFKILWSRKYPFNSLPKMFSY